MAVLASHRLDLAEMIPAHRIDPTEPATALPADAILWIDHDALVANYRILTQQVGKAEVAAVVKADGYGLGAVRVATTLFAAGCRHFFVAQLGEVVRLRAALPKEAHLYVLNGLQPGAETAAARLDAIPVLNSLDQIEAWHALAIRSGRRLPAVLQIDSGMGRLGLSPDDLEMLIAQRDRLDGIDLRLIMSHLACADDPDAEANRRQQAAFEAGAAHFPGVARSLDASGGSFLPRAGHFEMVRAGIALYGGAPHPALEGMLRPVVELRARIIQVRSLPAGLGLGYGLTASSDRPRRIATIGVGYADGWPRSLGNRGSAYVAGLRVPIVGRVSMDSILLDVSHIPEAALFPGALVELLGPHQGIDQVARDAGTIAYELLTRLGPRYAREHLAARADILELRS